MQKTHKNENNQDIYECGFSHGLVPARLAIRRSINRHGPAAGAQDNWRSTRNGEIRNTCRVPR